MAVEEIELTLTFLVRWNIKVIEEAVFTHKIENRLALNNHE